jgi:hypothetical protein
VLEELDGVDGLGEELEVVAAGACAGEDFDGGGLSANEDDASFGAEFEDGDGGFYAVECGHEDIGEKDGGLEAASYVDGIVAVVDGLSLKAAAGEDLDQSVGDEAFIVYDEDEGIGRLTRGVFLEFRGEEGRLRYRITGEGDGMHLGPRNYGEPPRVYLGDDGAAKPNGSVRTPSEEGAGRAAFSVIRKNA